MGPDERIVKYMKERDRFARTVACTVAVQLFALAIYFCMYVLYARAVYSLSENTVKYVVISIAGIIAVGLMTINILMVIRSEKVYITRPDAIAIRDASETVSLAYSVARPVLIFKITCILVMLTAGGLVYIMLMTFMEDATLAGLYGRIICCVIIGVAVIIAYPCIDRIACYRALRGETHELSYDIRPNKAYLISFAIATPLTICIWYILRYYFDLAATAWIVFPLILLFALAIPFLVRQSVSEGRFF